MGKIAVIPYRPRIYQAQAWNLLQRFNVLVWHRQAGKTVFAINWLIRRVLSAKHRDRRGAYLAPTYKQVKRIAWTYLKRYTAPIPGMRYLEQELRAVFPSGDEIWLLGAKDADALRGIYLDAVVPDEVAQMPPRLWDEIIRPTLVQYQGHGLMIGTPFGMANAFHEYYQAAQTLPGWYRSLMTVNDTNALPADEIEALRREMKPAKFAQEMLCSFSAAVDGAYFAAALERADQQGRITKVPRDPLLPVHTSWDLGMRHRTVVWFWQVLGAEVRVLKCQAFAGTGLPDIVPVLQSQGWTWGQHYAPHDAKVRELGTGKSRQEVAASLGMRWTLAPQVGLLSGIEQANALIERCWFDAVECKDGLEALRLYRTEFDDEHQVFCATPLEDWTNDYADSFRMFAVSSQGASPNWAPIDYRQLDRATI